METNFGGPDEAETRVEWRRAGTLGCLVWLAIVPTFLVVDRLGAVSPAPLVMELGLGCLLVTAVTLWLLATPSGHRHARALAVVHTITVGLASVALAAPAGGGASPEALIALVVVAGTLLMPWRLPGTVAAGLGPVGLYAAVAVASGPGGGAGVALAGRLLELAATATIAIVAARVCARRRRLDLVANMALAAALRRRSAAAARWSHDVRTPIDVMIGYADILLDDALERGGPEARQLLERIRGHGVKLRRLIAEQFEQARGGGSGSPPALADQMRPATTDAAVVLAPSRPS